MILPANILAKKLCPKGLSAEVEAEWMRVAPVLAHPDLDRLKPHFVDTILEYCIVTLRIKKLRVFFETTPEFFEVESRHGKQIRAHPGVAQLNEACRQRRSLASALGLSPNAERNILPGQGEPEGDAQDEFA